MHDDLDILNVRAEQVLRIAARATNPKGVALMSGSNTTPVTVREPDEAHDSLGDQQVAEFNGVGLS